ncbi:spermatogenesis-associated protein 4 [Pangasianodon hypophthalmus]|uniref:spermatogenesis-associated protein 4 n=1 Tax=Pangasianodon hypophthalmus TaxID=310915 RepID=UPI000F008167|nr:spermatogenesis-associated protein 4 [Pangasianodon hypophthalmus]
MDYSPPKKRSGLPREVWKWLQSLELSISPKNIRRDFSNGYLVAEVFSWYFPEDFSLHSYDNGASLGTKQSNWTQIEKVLVKRRVSLMKESINGTIHCKPGAAEALVQEIYTLLTNRRIQSVQEEALDFTDQRYQEQLPMVARATASKAIKNNLRLSEELAEPNISTTQRKIQNIIHRHVELRREERSQNPQRFNVKPTLGEQAVRLPPSHTHTASTTW